MKKERIIIIILVILLVGLLVAWIISIQPRGEQWVSVTGATWMDFQDTIHSQTDFNTTIGIFSITGSEWRIGWACVGMTDASHFDIVVHDVYTGSIVREIVTTTTETFSGQSILNSTGKFYLDVFIVGHLD